jgi:hypothetical protein
MMVDKAALHNAVCLALAALGMTMLAVALLDGLVHPITLWTSVP